MIRMERDVMEGERKCMDMDEREEVDGCVERKDERGDGDNDRGAGKNCSIHRQVEINSYNKNTSISLSVSLSLSACTSLCKMFLLLQVSSSRRSVSLTSSNTSPR